MRFDAALRCPYENNGQMFKEPDHFNGRAIILPRPQGEGWGEGEVAEMLIGCQLFNECPCLRFFAPCFHSSSKQLRLQPKRPFITKGVCNLGHGINQGGHFSFFAKCIQIPCP